MSDGEPSGGEGGGLLAGLLAPLRLPERVLEALDGIAESVRDLRPIRTEITRIRKQTEPLGELTPPLERVREDLADLAARIDGLHEVVAALESDRSHLNREVKAIHETLAGVKDDIQRTTGLRGERGLMERARDSLTGGNE